MANGMQDNGRVRDSRIFQYNQNKRKPTTAGLGLIRTPQQLFKRAQSIEVPGQQMQRQRMMREEQGY